MSVELQESAGFLPDRRFIRQPRSAFTLLELLTVISIITIILAITFPALNQVRRKSRVILGMNNQKQIVNAANFYALDNDHQYPESVATIGDPENWNWSEPMMLTGYRARSPRLHRSMSGYLYNYIRDADIMFCPSAPRKYTYLKESWDAGDNWDNPDTPQAKDPLIGTYCFYWNYVGFLKDRDYLFRGPQGPETGKSRSKLLVSDYFGFNHWRSRNSFSSCEYFSSADITEGTLLSSDYWSSNDNKPKVFPEIKLNAGYTDGHVESFPSLNTIGMQVILTPKTSEPYPDEICPGFFYLPKNALQ